MTSTKQYNGALTAEQFLFCEIRIAARFYLQGLDVTEAISKIRQDNLYQYPTEREVSRMTRACYKRIDALNSISLVQELANAPTEIAKQVNLYAIMKYNRLVWEFMVSLIGEKFQNQDFAFSRRDVNAFFTRLQEQNDDVAAWSVSTVNRIKRVLIKFLVETDFLDNNKSEVLNPVLISEELEEGIRTNHDEEALPAFNCFR